jgi:hypothetical protein
MVALSVSHIVEARLLLLHGRGIEYGNDNDHTNPAGMMIGMLSEAVLFLVM